MKVFCRIPLVVELSRDEKVMRFSSIVTRYETSVVVPSAKAPGRTEGSAYSPRVNILPWLFSFDKGDRQ